MKLSTAIEGYVLARTSHLSERTIRDYLYYLNLWLEQSGDPELASITRKDLHKFLAWLAKDYRTIYGKPASQSGQRHGWTAIRAFWAWVSLEFDMKNISAGIPGPVMPASIVIPFTRSDIQELLKAVTHSKWIKSDRRKTFQYKRADAHRDRGIVLVLLDTGVRIGELARLTVPDVDVKNRTVEVKPYGRGTKSRARVIPMTARTCSSLWRYLSGRQEAGEVFTKETALFAAGRNYISEGGGPMHREAIYQLIKRLGERANVQDCHPHRFRHTFAIEYLRGGGNPYMLKYLLGHSSMQMVERYLHFMGEDYQEMHQRASAVERWKL